MGPQPLILTIVLFLASAAAIAALWNRFFDPVSWRIVALFMVLAAAWMGETLFTTKVDIPANLAFHGYPWKVTGAPPVHANTGIIFTQIAPWTRIAREQLLDGTLPLWRRHAAGGAPLLANQQTAIFHPFTLLGLPLSVGKAFTLSASLRLFVLLFFTFVMLRGWQLREAAAIFGAVAYTFCTFHIVWLLFPLGLATMMLPMAMAGAQRLVQTNARSTYVLLTVALALSVLGGHPESALWVWVTTAAYVVYCARTDWRRVLIAASAFLLAALLTAFFWYPTLRALQSTERFRIHQSEANPADHGLSNEWLLPLIAPNVLGTPMAGTYAPPRGSHPAVLNDYGEVASSYAGLLTLALAASAVFLSRRRPVFFALGLMAFALLTFGEAPWWRDAMRAVPLAGVSILQRLRILWDLGVCIAAAVALHELLDRRRVLYVSLALCGAAVLAIYVVRQQELVTAHLLVPLATLVIFAIRPALPLATVLVLLDLAVMTWRYNPPAKPEHVYPATGAIRFMQQGEKPFRMTAWGSSFVAETSTWYGLEDIKTTDPVQHFAYMFLLRGYLDIPRDSADLVIRNVERAYFDFLNVRYLYVPADHDVKPAGFVERYRGPDGVVLENAEVLPRYFFTRAARVEPDLGMAVALSRFIKDFRVESIVDRKAAEVPATYAGGEVHVRSYEGGRTVLDVDSRGWNLLVTSDTHWPGWRARIGGRPAPVVTVNAAFVGVFVPPGKVTVELWYWPEELTHGLIASAAGIVLLLLAAAWPRRATIGSGV